MRLIFMGTPEFAVPTLERLVHDGREIVAAFTQPDKPSGRGKKLNAPPVKLAAESHGIPVYQPARIKANEEVRAVFEEAAADACIVAAYGKILPEWLLRIPRLGCINVHASLLPRYRGAAPINWVIANGERETGITIMQMDAGMDTGPLLAARAIHIGERETASQLSIRLSQLGADVLSETLPKIEQGRITPIAQDNAQATYAPILKREDGLINVKLTAQEISNRVRAFEPWPGVFTTFRGQRLMIRRAEESQARLEYRIGSVISIDHCGIRAACAEQTALLILELQIEGKRRMSAWDFANGMRLRQGDDLFGCVIPMNGSSANVSGEA